MSKDKIIKQGNNPTSKNHINGGYQPLNEGYQPKTHQKGYQPNNPVSSISNDNLPQGGTGQMQAGAFLTGYLAAVTHSGRLYNSFREVCSGR